MSKDFTLPGASNIKAASKGKSVSFMDVFDDPARNPLRQALTGHLDEIKDKQKKDIAKLEAEQAARKKGNVTPVSGDIQRRIAAERKATTGRTGRLSTMMTAGNKLG